MEDSNKKGTSGANLHKISLNKAGKRHLPRRVERSRDTCYKNIWLRIVQKINHDTGKGTVSHVNLAWIKWNSLFPITGRGFPDILRVGIIGFGRRAEQLSAALGFMHPEEVKKTIIACKLA